MHGNAMDGMGFWPDWMYRHRLLTICIMQTIDQSNQLINIIYYSTLYSYIKAETHQNPNTGQLNEHVNTANTFTVDRCWDPKTKLN